MFLTMYKDFSFWVSYEPCLRFQNPLTLSSQLWVASPDRTNDKVIDQWHLHMVIVFDMYKCCLYSCPSDIWKMPFAICFSMPSLHLLFILKKGLSHFFLNICKIIWNVLNMGTTIFSEKPSVDAPAPLLVLCAIKHFLCTISNYKSAIMHFSDCGRYLVLPQKPVPVGVDTQRAEELGCEFHSWPMVRLFRMGGVGRRWNWEDRENRWVGKS